MLKFGRNKNFGDWATLTATACVAIIFLSWDLKNILYQGSEYYTDYGLISNDFYFQPFFSIYINDLIRNNFGVVTLIVISQIIFPVCIFYMLVIIFSRYLDKVWSIAIGFISIFSFSEHAFREFLLAIIRLDQLYAVNYSLPEIANFPIPSLSVLLFLISFYSSTKAVKLNSRRISILTCFWSVQIYIKAIDALFGICFWFSYFIIKCYRHQDVKCRLLSLICLQLVISFFIYLPAFYFSDFSLFSLAISSEKDFHIFSHCFLYMALPISLLLFLFLIHKIDAYEIFYKFWSIFILMFLEFILILIAFFFKKAINLGILTTGVTLFFLHFYYYLPVIFYASRQYYSFHIGKDGNRVKNVVRKIIFIIFNRLNYVYLPLIIILSALFALMSSNNNFVGSFLWI